jgi:predicted metal-dependent hydrolase
MTSPESFEFNNWTVEVHRRPRRASISIYLYPHKPIKVMAAKSTTQRVIEDFLLAKKNWIEKNLQKFENLPKPEEKKFQSNEIFPFRGKDLKLKPVITLHKKKFISATDEHLLLHIPRNDWSASVLWQEHPEALKEIREFYKREALRELAARVQHWSRQMNLFPKQLRFREQRTRWGSCSSRGVINLNWRLVVFAGDIMDYVIVHELAHLQHMNHSHRFWSVVEKYLPRYESTMKDLKNRQYLCEFLSEK